IPLPPEFLFLRSHIDQSTRMHFEQAVERGPAHRLRQSVMPRRASAFPDAAVGLAPLLARGLSKAPQHSGFDTIERHACRCHRLGGDDDLAIDVELTLVNGSIADPNRA